MCFSMTTFLTSIEIKPLSGMSINKRIAGTDCHVTPRAGLYLFEQTIPGFFF